MDLVTYTRYQMIYPYESNKIFRSKTINNVIKKCISEVKPGYVGKLTVIDLDRNIFYDYECANSIKQNTV
jgi:hypothetical protein